MRLTATGGVAPYTFSMKGMPPGTGLTLSPDGVLSGVPEMIGEVSFTVFARDRYGCVGSRKYTITIERPIAESAAPSDRLTAPH